MSRFMHVICDDCWKKKQPQREPVRISNPHEHTCCFCSQPTKSGIYVREDPADMPCNGEHPRD